MKTAQVLQEEDIYPEFHDCPGDGKQVTGEELLQRIVKAQFENEQAGYKPIITKKPSYVCETCGEAGHDHPANGYCYVCNTDDWLSVAQWDFTRGRRGTYQTI